MAEPNNKRRPGRQPGFIPTGNKGGRPKMNLVPAAFKIFETQAAALKQIPNQNQFVREAIAAALDKITITPAQTVPPAE